MYQLLFRFVVLKEREVKIKVNQNYDFTYFKQLSDKQYEEALLNLQRLINETDKNGKINQFIFWCLEEFKKEQIHESIKLYLLTEQSIYDFNSIRFLENLYHFISYNICDNGYFIIEYYDYPDEYYESNDVVDKFGCIYKKTCIRQVNGVFDFNDDINGNWEPVLKSTYNNDNETHNIDYILSAIKFLEDREKYMKEQWNKLSMNNETEEKEGE